MTESEKPRKKITLKHYVDFLEEVSKGKVTKTAFLKGMDAKIANSLEDEGLITEGVFKFPGGGRGIANEVIITPSGAQALVEWREVIQENSIWYKFMSGFSRLFWIAVGWIGAVAAPSFSNIIEPIVDQLIKN